MRCQIAGALWILMLVAPASSQTATPITSPDDPAFLEALQRAPALFEKPKWKARDIDGVDGRSLQQLLLSNGLLLCSGIIPDGIVAFDAATGEKKWSIEKSPSVMPEPPPSRSPFVTAPSPTDLILGNDGPYFDMPTAGLIARSPLDGAEKWRLQTNFWPAPAVVGPLVIVGGRQRPYNGAYIPTPFTLAAYDRTTGVHRWSREDQPVAAATTPLPHGDLVLVTTTSAERPASVSLLALKAGDGSMAHRYLELKGSTLSPPATGAGLVLCVTAAEEAVAFDIAGGGEKWRTPLSPAGQPAPKLSTISPIVPVVDRDLLLARLNAKPADATGPTTIAGIAALDLQTGKQLWYFSLNWIPGVNAYAWTVTPSKDFIFITARNYLVVLDRQGKLAWALKAGANITMGAPVVDDGAFYFATKKGSTIGPLSGGIYAFNLPAGP